MRHCSLDEADAEDGSEAEAAAPLAEPESFEHPEDEGDERVRAGGQFFPRLKAGDPKAN